PVAHAALRLKEAAKLGFQRALVPPSVAGHDDLTVKPFRTLANLVDHVLGRD
ncbi:MAG: DNA repair protein RadA, partial [Sphingomonadales bacterium]